MTALVLARAPASIARATIAQHSKSFALASALLGRRLRDETAIVYTWCRHVDDAIDATTAEAAPSAALVRLRGELDAVYAGTANDPLLRAIG